MKIGLLGAGSQARETIDYCDEGNIDVSFLAVDKQFVIQDTQVRMIDIIHPNRRDVATGVIAAIGAPALKRDMIDLWPGSNYAALVSSMAWVSKKAHLEEGVLVSPNASIARDVILGRHVLVNIGVTISHDVKVGDYSTIAPGVNIGGNTTIEEGVYVGIGAKIKNGIHIASGAIIGAGAVVIDSVDQNNAVIVGVPGRQVRVNGGWLHEI